MATHSFGKLVREKAIPVEIGKIWTWLKPFDSAWMKYFPAIKSLDLLNKNCIKNNESGLVGLVRHYVIEQEGVAHHMKERLEFSDDASFILIYSLQEYQSVPLNGALSAEKEEKVDFSGTVFHIQLKGYLSDIDNTPETSIVWACHFNSANSKLKRLVEKVFTLAIESCFQKFEDKFNGVIGKCTVFLKHARKLITADVFSSDPYCTLRMVDMPKSAAVKSAVKKWTKNPDYNQEFVLDVRPKSIKLILEFLDYDVGDTEDDHMGMTETDFSLLAPGVKQELTLNLNTQGTVTLLICIDMFDNKPIPLDPELRRKRMQSEKAKKAACTNQQLEESGLEHEAKGAGDLPQFVQAKLMQDLGMLASQDQCKLMALGHLYLTSLNDEISNNVDLKQVFKQPAATTRRETSQSIKLLLRK